MVNNPVPGENLLCCDLVRNYLLSPVLNLPLNLQVNSELLICVSDLDLPFFSHDPDTDPYIKRIKGIRKTAAIIEK